MSLANFETAIANVRNTGCDVSLGFLLDIGANCSVQDMTISQKVAILDTAVVYFSEVCPVCWFLRCDRFEGHNISTCRNYECFPHDYGPWRTLNVVPSECCRSCTTIYDRTASQVYLPTLW